MACCCFNKKFTEEVPPQSLSALDLEVSSDDIEKQQRADCLDNAIIESPELPSFYVQTPSFIMPTTAKTFADGLLNVAPHDNSLCVTPGGCVNNRKVKRRSSFGSFGDRHTSFGGTLGRRASIGGPGARNAYILKPVNPNNTSAEVFRPRSSSLGAEVQLPRRSSSFREPRTIVMAPMSNRSSFLQSIEEVDSDSGVSSYGTDRRSSLGGISMRSSEQESSQRRSSFGSSHDRSLVGVHGVSSKLHERRSSLGESSLRQIRRSSIEGPSIRHERHSSLGEFSQRHDRRSSLGGSSLRRSSLGESSKIKHSILHSSSSGSSYDDDSDSVFDRCSFRSTMPHRPSSSTSEEAAMIKLNVALGEVEKMTREVERLKSNLATMRRPRSASMRYPPSARSIHMPRIINDINRSIYV